MDGCKDKIEGSDRSKENPSFQYPWNVQDLQAAIERERPFADRFIIKNKKGFYRWLDFLDELVLCDKSADSSGWVFRGQADAQWVIKSSFERSVLEPLEKHWQKCDEEDVLAIERKMIEEFRSRCGGEFDVAPDDYMGWLCVMQHYGAPTRLVDFSVSPLISLYMATRRWNPAIKEFAVWACYRPKFQTVYNSRIPWYLSKSKCNNSLCKCSDDNAMSSRKENTLANIEKGRRSNWECANCFFRNEKCGERETNFPKVLWITPQVSNARIRNQRGLFLMPTLLSKKTMQQLCWSCQTGRCVVGETFLSQASKPIANVGDAAKTRYLIQFVFSSKLHTFVSRFLARANIRGSMLFPGVEGVAEELGEMAKNNAF